MTSKLVLLDRDGVLNRHRIHPDQGTIDSPLHPSQVELYDDAIKAVAELDRMGYTLAICTNQPSSATGKTTKENLIATHDVVVKALEKTGVKLAGSFICFHRNEDNCDCRKPKPGLLKQALAQTQTKAADAWFVGDAMTDVQAGQAAGVKTVFLGKKKLEHRRVFEEKGVAFPDLWCENLAEFVATLKEKA